jgi:hypothetical protein
MRLIFIFLFVFLLGGCSSPFHTQPSEKSRIASEIRSKVAKKLRDEMDLIPFGSGGQMMYQIKMLGLAFQYRNPIGMEEIRRLLMKAYNVFNIEINSNEKIRPYLDVYPFGAKNIEVQIVLLKPDGSSVYKGELELIVIREGVLQYNFSDPNYSLYRVIEEAYEEALEIIQNSGKSDLAV